MGLLDQLTPTLVEHYTKELSGKDRQDLYRALSALSDLKKRRVFYDTFPDEGEFRRELYPKHIQFMDAGNDYRERLIMAGNRVGKCVSYNTLIDLPDGSKKEAGKLYEQGAPFQVMSWDGNQPVEATVVDCIEKPEEQLYRVWLSDGTYFDCSGQHRVLTQDHEYKFVEDVLSYVPCLPVSNLEHGLLIQTEDVVRWFEKLQDYINCYLENYHLYDEQLHVEVNTYLTSVPSQGDVQQHNYSWFYKDDLENKYICSHLQVVDLLSSLCVPDLALAQNTSLEDQDDEQDVQLQKHNNQSDLPTASELYLRLRIICETLLKESLCVSLLSPYSIDGKYIIAYNLIPISKVYDFYVPQYKNYISHGIVHHNTIVGAFECTCHATGEYPHWWKGKRYIRPPKIWIGGDTTQTVRDIIQDKLLGKVGQFGTGMIPKDKIIGTKPKRNLPDSIEIINVKHVSGGTSQIMLKTYEQGRETWQGTEVDFIWMDEEPPSDIYSEALLRTMTTDGIMILTFTPLRGQSDVVVSFLDSQKDPESSKFMVMASWNDVPHLSESAKKEMLKSIPPNEREARSEGVPVIGAGRIYPVGEEIYVEPFQIPKYWGRAFGMDVGWNCTAAVWGALDRDTDTVYIYDEYYGMQQEVAVHANAIRRRGPYQGVIDPASRGKSQIDGKRLFDIYTKDQGLKLRPADNSVEAGIYEVWSRFSEGRLKIFKNCVQLKRELSMYHRDDKGKINKANDHGLDAMRYLMMSGIKNSQPLLQAVNSSTRSAPSSLAWI